MDTEEIKREISLIEQNIVDRGYCRPEVWFAVNWLGNAYTICVKARTGSTSDGEKMDFIHDRNRPRQAFNKAWKFTDKLPDPDDQRRQAFMRELGRVIDRGREIGIEVDYLNPLEQAMRQLSENIITHQEAAE